ncbi:hypothetical protein ACFWIO_22495 [Streptomyces diastatochromogenes]|uniref:hypothetical protein n=1 Tax=Streptomyces diastatochromogenes TaxID=42236 RepID=UPI0036496472
MSPEHTTTSQPGPAAQGGFARTRRLAAIAAAVTVAVATPAVAVAAGMTSQKGATYTYASDPHDQCDHQKPRGGGGDECESNHPKPTVTVTKTATATATVTATATETKTATATATVTATVTATATACGPGVDSTNPNGDEQFLAALVEGVPFAGRRPSIAPSPDNPNIVSGPSNDPGWTDLSQINGFPKDPVCGVSVDAHGGDAFYKIITTGGHVFTLHCAATRQTTLVCPAPRQGNNPPSQWIAVDPQPSQTP